MSSLLSEKTDIKDYIHLYLNSNIECVYYETHFMAGQKFILTDSTYFYCKSHPKEVKPILRPLSSMTEEEKLELIRVNHPEKDYPIITSISFSEHGLMFSAKDERMRHSMNFSVGFSSKWMPNETLWLLSKSFDIFNLIEKGLALSSSNEDYPMKGISQRVS